MMNEDGEIKFFDIQLAAPAPSQINLLMLTNELKNMRPLDRKERIDEMVLNGQIHPKVYAPGKKKPAAFEFFMINGQKFHYIRCIACGFYVAVTNGGHKTVHTRRRCIQKRSIRDNARRSDQITPQFDDFVEEEFMEETTSSTSSNHPISGDQYQSIDKSHQLLDIISTYCLASGTSFKHVESEPWRELMTAVLKIGGISDYDISQIHLPGASQVRNYCEKFKFGQIIRNISEEISQYIRDGSASIHVDFGVHVRKFASAFIVFVNVSDGEEFKIEIKPLGFCPTMCLSSGEDIRQWIVDSAAQFDISETEILKLNLVTEGVYGMEIEGFQNCDNSGCSKIEKLTEWILNPPPQIKKNLAEKELQILAEYQQLIDNFVDIGRMVKQSPIRFNYPSIENLPFFPTFPEKIRFAKEISGIFDEVKSDKRIESLIKKELIDISKIAELDEIFSKFEPLVQIFEKNEVSIHHFLPKISALNEFFKSKIGSGAGDSPKTILYKSAQLVSEHFLSHEISNLHYKTTMLSPGHRRMTKLSPEAKEKAIKLLEEELKCLPESDVKPVIREEMDDFDDDYDAPIDKVEENELSVYLEETALNRDEPLAFWSRRQSEFPKLSRVAFRCFSLISTRSLIEKTFEKVQKVVDIGEDPDIAEKMIISGFEN